MPLSDDAAIERLALRLVSATLARSEWTHEAHFAAALWLARHRPEATGPDAMRGIITRYNEAAGTPNTDESGYHHTITLASMRAVRHLLAGHPEDAPLTLVLDEAMRSELGRSDWLFAYWTRETLLGVPARRSWVEPDRTALPF